MRYRFTAPARRARIARPTPGVLARPAAGDRRLPRGSRRLLASPARVRAGGPACPFSCTSITQVGGVAFQDNPIRLIKVDPETMETIGMITSTDIPEIGNSWGLATDVEGYLWAVEMGTRAFKIDRTDYSYQFFQNISSMYTYSDMTGFGLKNVVPM